MASITMSAQEQNGSGGSTIDGAASSAAADADVAALPSNDINKELGQSGVSASTTEDDDQDVKDAKAGFVAPNAYTIHPAPRQATNTSIIHKYGLKLKPSNGKGGSWAYACFANAACRADSARGKFVSIGSSATSNALEHCKKLHNIAGPSKKTQSSERTKTALEDRIERSLGSDMYMTNRSRFLGLDWIKMHVVDELGSLSTGENQSVRAHWRLACHPEFPVNQLHREGVKHQIVELYAATTDRVKKELHTHVGDSCILHLNLDIWVDKLSNLKYIGIRVFYVNNKWELKAHVLAVRQFNPTSEALEINRLSSLLETYLLEVLQQFELNVADHVYSSTTDGGSDVKRLCNKLLPSFWSWCNAHMLNCALVEGVGTHLSPSGSHNQDASKVVVLVKKTAEHVNKSPRATARFNEESIRCYGKAVKLKNAAPHRWHGVADVLGGTIANFDAIRALYVDREQVPNPLEAHKEEIEELYSLIKPMADIIRDCQKTSVPTGVMAVLSLSALILDTLNIDKDLQILTPICNRQSTAAAKVGGDRVEGEEEGGTPFTQGASTARAHGDLTPMAQTTRAKLAHAIRWRWYDTKYGDKAPGASDYVLDLQMLLHPAVASQGYIDALIPDPTKAQQVKETIRAKFVDLVVELAEAAAENDHQKGGGEKERDMPPPPKRQKAGGAGGAGGEEGRAGGTSSGSEDARVQMYSMFRSAGTKHAQDKAKRYANLGLFDNTPKPGPSWPSLRDKANQEMKEFSSISGVSLANVGDDETLAFWKTHGARSFPNMARAARVLLGAPASAAVLERDLNAAGRMTTSARNTTDSAWVEMIMFLNGNREVIPDDLPELSETEKEEAIPGRLKIPDPELRILEGDIVQDTDDPEDI